MYLLLHLVLVPFLPRTPLGFRFYSAATARLRAAPGNSHSLTAMFYTSCWAEWQAGGAAEAAAVVVMMIVLRVDVADEGWGTEATKLMFK